MTKLYIKYGIISIICSCAFSAFAQEDHSKRGEQANYFIDIKAEEPAMVYQVIDGVGNIKYFDEYGEQDYLTVAVYDWKHENIANYHLSKSYGLNYYTIEMSWLQENQTYLLKATDEKGKQYNTTIQGSGELKLDPPKVEIVVNPIALSCETVPGNMVEFYAAISGGRPPYEVQWFVLNKSVSKLLYSPHREKINDLGKGMAVLVDQPPSYHVLLQVTDICGNEVKKMVSISCREKEEVYHSIFIEPIPVGDRIGNRKK